MSDEKKFIDVVFDGPPDHDAPRFIEVEDPNRASVNAGEWIDRGDGTWALRLTPESTARALYSPNEYLSYLLEGLQQIIEAREENA